MRTFLAGTEELTFEIEGSLPLAVARSLVGPALSLEERGGAARVNLLVFSMRGLGLQGFPWGRLDYGEALWRIGVELAGGVAWLGHACDLDDARVRLAGRWLVRYPVRAARFTWPRPGDRQILRVEAEGGLLEAEAEMDAEEPPPEPPRPLLVREGRTLYRIPWEEVPAPHRARARFAVRDDGLGRSTLGTDVTWSGAGLVHRGRTHRCGVAVKLRGDAGAPD